MNLTPSTYARLPWPSRGVARFALDWLPVFIVLFVYDEIHNRLGPFLPPPHTFPQIHFDQMLFGGTVPAVTLQRLLYAGGHPHGWDVLALTVYTSHFVLAVVIALVLWTRSRPQYLRFMTWFVGLTTIGYITYALYPAVPPWLASQHGDLAPTHRIVRETWDYLGLHNIAVLFSGTNIYANDIAAIPSLHAAYPLMIAIMFWKHRGWAMRVGMTLYVIVMALVLVYTAEHYVVDILLGWLYAVGTAFVMSAVWPQEPVRRRLVT
jgi:hypothetical protein